MKAPKPRRGPEPVLALADLHDGNQGSRAIDTTSAAGLAHSLAEFGDLSGIVLTVVGNGLEKVAGHQRLAQLEAAGATSWTLLAMPAGDRDGAGYVEHPMTGARFPVRIVAWDAQKAAAARFAANNAALAGTFTAAALPQLDALRDFPAFAELRLEALRLDLLPLPPPDAQAPDVSSAALRTFSFVLTEEDGAVVDRAFARLRDGAPGGTADAVLFAQVMRTVVESP